MGFRFFKILLLNNNLHKSISRISSSSYKSNPYPNHHHNHPVIQALNPPITHIDNPNFKIPKRFHGGHSDHHDHHSEEGGKIFRLGLAADIGLAAGKAFTGYMSGSTAIIADAAHSLSDVVLSGVALLSFQASRVPKDKEHPYGHGKFETLGALGISGMLLVTAGGIAWHALDVLVGVLSAAPEVINQSLAHQPVHDHHGSGHSHGIDMDHPILALNTTIVAIGVKEWLYWMTKRAGDRAGSGLMKANAWHHRADAISSVVALVGVGGHILGIKFLDPLAGLVVSGMILKAGLETGYQSVLELVDAAVPSSLLDPIKQTALQVEGVKGCNHLRGRRAGPFLYLDVNVEVDPFCSVSEAHDIGEKVRHEIQNSHHEVSEVFIHLDPSTLHSSPAIKDLQEDREGTEDRNNTLSEHKEIEETIYNMLTSKFSEKMVVERITRHMLQEGKLLFQIEVSMAPDTLVRDAMEVAEEAEKSILDAVPNVMKVCFQLCLGRAIPKIHQDLQENMSEEV